MGIIHFPRFALSNLWWMIYWRKLAFSCVFAILQFRTKIAKTEYNLENALLSFRSVKSIIHIPSTIKITIKPSKMTKQIYFTYIFEATVLLLWWTPHFPMKPEFLWGLIHPFTSCLDQIYSYWTRNMEGYKMRIYLNIPMMNLLTSYLNFHLCCQHF